MNPWFEDESEGSDDPGMTMAKSAGKRGRN
jgi:hypothetical protein